MRPSRRLLIWLKTPGERGGAGESHCREASRCSCGAGWRKIPRSPRRCCREGIHTMLAGDGDTGKAILRDYTQATVDCEAGSQSGLALLVQDGRRTWR